MIIKDISDKFVECDIDYFIHLWNPTPELINDIIPLLEKHRKFALIWCCGKIENLYDYSKLSHYRVSKPIYLCENYDNVLELQKKAFNEMLEYMRVWRK